MRSCFLMFLAGAVCCAGSASGDLYINEMFFNPGGGANDFRDEFIEIRGDTPGMSLENHYLIFIENELDEFGVGEAGLIENIFDLGAANNGSAASLGSNGFLVFRQKFNRYSGDQIIATATQLVNDGPNKPGGFPGAFPGFGNSEAEGSTIGHSDLDTGDQDPTTGATENSGFTAMLIYVDPLTGAAPELNFDLDDGNDGLDNPNGQDGWTILDSVGTFGEGDETEFGRLYGRANFGSGDLAFFAPGWTPNIEPGASFELLPYEVEYMGRWGNSTGYTVDDWHVSNLTDNDASGSQGGANGNTGPVDLRQSAGDPHPVDDMDDTTPAPTPANPVESNKGVPYGTKLLTNIGGPNFILGDFNGDGVVNAADYTVWRDTEGQTGFTEANHPAADPNHDFKVNGLDYAIWAANYGAPGNSPSTSNSATTPEPGALWLMSSFLVVWRGRAMR